MYNIWKSNDNAKIYQLYKESAVVPGAEAKYGIIFKTNFFV